MTHTMYLKVTAKHPEAEVKAILKLAARVVGVKHDSWSVWVKNSRNVARGTCYYGRHHITIGIGPASAFPRPSWNRRPSTVFATWQEALADVAGHELGHAKMKEDGRRQSETEANWYGWAALKAYRESVGQAEPA
jgi:hypothetical protein